MNRKYRRETRYPCPATTNLDQNASDAIDSLAVSNEMARSAIIREAILLGLPTVQRSYERKQEADRARKAGI